jgi:hypothetical protein
MRTKMMLKVAALSLTASLALMGCHSGGTKGDLAVVPDLLTVGDLANADAVDGGGEEDFEVFVLNLIQTQTSDSTLPTAIDGKMFTDSMNPAVFDPLF